MNYCEFIKCGDYTGHGCKVLGGNIKCRSKYDAEPYADACVAARDKEWIAWVEKHTVRTQVGGVLNGCYLIGTDDWKERKGEGEIGI